ncbi:MAG: MarR family transcriptional regulator [Actinomycetota bacterium]|nr:MarR family transcriptional regulator [Actinomycetota bacterium]
MSADTSDRVEWILRYILERDPGRDLTAKGLALRLRRAAHHIDTETRRRLAPLGMELWEVEILAELDRVDGGASMGQLQDLAQLTSGAITNRVGRLEEKGFVERVLDPQDRRQVRVRVTGSGRARLAEVIDANNAAEREIYAGIDERLLQRLSRDLHAFLLATEGPSSG